MREIPIAAQPLERFAALIGEEAMRRHEDAAAAIRERFHGRVLWNVSSTALGGGVAEMLRSQLPYVRGAGIDMRWLVLAGSPPFFRVTKRIHNALHGSAGDGTPLDANARAIYEGQLASEAGELVPLIHNPDLVILHDPQSAGLAPALRERGASVIWRCHIGQDAQDDETRAGWAFLDPYLGSAHAMVFSRRAFVPPSLDAEKVEIIYPSIDPFSPKNQRMDEATVMAILHAAGIVEGGQTLSDPLFAREDGSPGRVSRKATVHDWPPGHDVPLVVQVSRWDTLKDHPGVIRGFVEMLESGRGGAAHLVVAGPNTGSIADDPEGIEAFNVTHGVYQNLPDEHRARVHVVTLPMEDPEENAAMVNALQRHATVIVQKSLAEGFGLTVTEAMAKGRPLVASGVGGILERIDDGVHGRLLRNPADRAEFASAVAGLLEDPAGAAAMGVRARERALLEFTGLQSLYRYAGLLARVDDGRMPAGGGGQEA